MKFLSDLFDILEEYLRLQKYILVERFKDAFHSVFNSQLFISSDKVSHPAVSSHALFIFEQRSLSFQEATASKTKGLFGLGFEEETLDYNLAIPCTEFAFTTSIDASSVHCIAVYLKYFESVSQYLMKQYLTKPSPPPAGDNSSIPQTRAFDAKAAE